MTRNIIPRLLCVLSTTVVFCSMSVVASAQTNRSAARSQTGRARTGNRSPVLVRARANDTLAALASRFNVSVEELAHANSINIDARLQPGQQLIVPVSSASGQRSTVAPLPELASSTPPVQANEANRLRLVDGTSVEFDDTWEDARGVWYRKGGVVHLVARNRVASIERKSETADDEKEAGKAAATRVKIVEVSEAERKPGAEPIWIYLVGGARVEADEVTETTAGAWYRHGSLSIFLERSRIERIERERPSDSSNDSSAVAGSWITRGWTTGNQKLDAMIRLSGQHFGVDPYLIFCVMEQESRFNVRALSPKGARGLMQLMPGTAARLGVRDSFDPQQNIMGGTRYLKMLLEQFGGRVDLVLASYNAGEGAVLKYGGNVPPYRETREYVRRIGARYGQNNSLVQPVVMTSRATATRQK